MAIHFLEFLFFFKKVGASFSSIGVDSSSCFWSIQEPVENEMKYSHSLVCLAIVQQPTNQRLSSVHAQKIKLISLEGHVQIVYAQIKTCVSDKVMIWCDTYIHNICTLYIQ